VDTLARQGENGLAHAGDGDRVQIRAAAVFLLHLSDDRDHLLERVVHRLLDENLKVEGAHPSEDAPKVVIRQLGVLDAVRDAEAIAEVYGSHVVFELVIALVCASAVRHRAAVGNQGGSMHRTLMAPESARGVPLGAGIALFTTITVSEEPLLSDVMRVINGDNLRADHCNDDVGFVSFR